MKTLCVWSIPCLYIVRMSSVLCVMLGHIGIGSYINRLGNVGESYFGCYVNLAQQLAPNTADPQADIRGEYRGGKGGYGGVSPAAFGGRYLTPPSN